MKRTLILVALFLALGAGAWYAIDYRKNKRQGSSVSWDMDFAVKNPDDIGKIFLADRKGNTATLERKEDHWIYNGRDRARPTAVNLLLETMQKVNVWYIPPQAAEPTMIKTLAADGIKVEIYSKEGKIMKTYYVGGVTNDEKGTYFMMDGAEQPYVMHVPSFVGQVRLHYALGDDYWRDRAVFHEKPEQIQMVSVEYPQQKSASFKLEKTGSSEYVVKPFYSTTKSLRQEMRKGAPEAYLVNFENKGAEAFETLNRDRDSIRALVPFAVVTVKSGDSTEKTTKFWPQAVLTDRKTGNNYVERFYAETPEGYFLLVQQRVFGPIFRGYDSFYEREAPGGNLRQ